MYSELAKQNRRLATCYVGIVGPDTQTGVCSDSIANIRLRPGDTFGGYARATKGFDARQSHINRWINETKHGAILLLDHDQTFPVDTLERLRGHGFPFVSGYYMRRQIRPIAPVWFDDNPSGLFPVKPFTDDPERGRLHKLAASGWGCMFIHREVIEATKPILKGEQEVLEDDMDVYPYDLTVMLDAINRLVISVMDPRNVDIKRQEIRDNIMAINDEFRPLTAIKENIGSDIRYPYYAKMAGYQLYGDPDVRCGHTVNYLLHPDDYTNSHHEQPIMKEELVKKVKDGRKEHAQRLKDLGAALK